MRKEKTISLKCPAKLNLFLDVLEKRPDGYHDISTIYEKINLSDEIILTTRPDGLIKIFCSDPDVPLDSSNLCYKAAQVLQQDYMIPDGVDIEIKKHIPVASGLGGGSSDAAGVLIGLNKIWNLGLDQERILSYAAKVGSDVSFFVENKKFAIGSGRGEIIKGLNFNPKGLYHILVAIQDQLFAKDIYSDLSLGLTKEKGDINILPLALKSSDTKGIREGMYNALEKVVEKHCSAVIKVKKTLIDLGVKKPMVSGSGPAVFALTDSQQEAEKIVGQLSKEGKWRTYVVTTI